jgi:hypothetical protein
MFRKLCYHQEVRHVPNRTHHIHMVIASWKDIPRKCVIRQWIQERNSFTQNVLNMFLIREIVLMIEEYAPFLKEFDCDPQLTTSFRDQNRPFLFEWTRWFNEQKTVRLKFLIMTILHHFGSQLSCKRKIYRNNTYVCQWTDKKQNEKETSWFRMSRPKIYLDDRKRSTSLFCMEKTMNQFCIRIGSDSFYTNDNNFSETLKTFSSEYNSHVDAVNASFFNEYY